MRRKSDPPGVTRKNFLLRYKFELRDPRCFTAKRGPELRPSILTTTGQNPRHPKGRAEISPPLVPRSLDYRSHVIKGQGEEATWGL